MKKNVSVMSLVLFVAVGLFFGLQSQKATPNFKDFDAGTVRKQAFVDYFLPLIKAENARVLERRNRLLEMDSIAELGFFERRWVQQLASDYRLKAFDPSKREQRSQLLSRVDIIAPSLILAQAANESAWGTSRFARQANNFFGHWCFKTGCGLVPASREAGAKHEVAAFGSATESLQRYMLNLNTHSSYQDFRRIRAEKRAAQTVAGGSDLAGGLLSYSERGAAYVADIRQMIAFNGWAKFD